MCDADRINWGCAPSSALREGALGTVRTLEFRSPRIVRSALRKGKRPDLNSPEIQKAPLVGRGSAKLPVGTLSVKHHYCSIPKFALSVRAEDDGFEP